MPDLDQQLKNQNALLAQQNYLAARSLQAQQKQAKKNNGLLGALFVLGALHTYSDLKTTQQHKQRANQVLDYKAAHGEITQAEADSFKYPDKEKNYLWVPIFYLFSRSNYLFGYVIRGLPLRQKSRPSGRLSIQKSEAIVSRLVGSRGRLTKPIQSHPYIHLAEWVIRPPA